MNKVRCTVIPVDLRDFFVRTLAALIRQGGPSMVDSSMCAYRGQQGRACAIGVWLPDEKYKRSLEGPVCSAD